MPTEVEAKAVVLDRLRNPTDLYVCLEDDARAATRTEGDPLSRRAAA